MLWLIRHAQSEANAGMISLDYIGMGLTALGQAQAERLAQWWREAPARVVVSPYARARQTAMPLLARFPSVPVQELSVQEFTYLDPARCQRTSVADREPMVIDYWQRMEPHFRQGPGAETFAELVARVKNFIIWAKQAEPNSLVFTHEQFLRAALWFLLRGSLEATTGDMRAFFALRSAWTIPNTAVIGLQFRADGAWIRPPSLLHLSP